MSKTKRNQAEVYNGTRSSKEDRKANKKGLQNYWITIVHTSKKQEKLVSIQKAARLTTPQFTMTPTGLTKIDPQWALSKPLTTKGV